MGSRGGKAYLLLGVFVLSQGPGVSPFSLSAKAQRGLLGERSQLAYSLISPFNDFVGGVWEKNSRKLYFTIRLSKSFRRIPAKIAYLTFLFCYLNFFFNTAKFTLKPLNIWSCSCRCYPCSCRCYPWFPAPCWPSSLDGFEGKMTRGMSGSS